MSKMKMLMTLIVTGLVFSVNSVKAISDEEYNRLKLVFSDAKISTMSEEEKINYLTKYNLENAITSSVYFKGVSNNNNNDSYTWTEITKEEYEQEKEIAPYSNYYSTNYKEESLVALPFQSNSKYYTFTLYANWFAMPAIRSYDVIAMRFYNVALISDTQNGMQKYRKKGASSHSSVDYSPNGTNISKQDAGFGISMNLVDDSIDYLHLEINCEGVVSGTNPHVYGAYQHAVSNVTLAQSKSYTISGAGYGNVINFSTSVQNKYDGMRGVDIAL